MFVLNTNIEHNDSNDLGKERLKSNLDAKGQKPFFRKWQIITISVCAPGFAFVHAIWRTIHVKGTLFIPNFITDLIIISIYITVPMVLVSVVLRIIDKKRNSGSKGEEP